MSPDWAWAQVPGPARKAALCSKRPAGATPAVVTADQVGMSPPMESAQTSASGVALMAARAEHAVRNALKEPVTFENYELLVQKAVESGVITEEQATTVRLAEEAARAVIEVDEFTRAEIEGFDEPAIRPAVRGD